MNNSNYYNYNKNSDNKRFFDKTKAGAGLEAIQYKRKEIKRKRKRFLKLLLADLLIALFGLVVFTLFHMSSQNKYTSASVALAQSNDAVLPNTAVTSPQPSLQSQNSVNLASATACSGPTPTPEPMLNNTFADKFTDGEVVVTDNSYQSGNINLAVNKVQDGDVVYYVADIYLKNISNFQTALAHDQFGESVSDSIQNISASNNALLALTGDYYSAHSDGVVIRNGVLYRDTLWRDVLIMYNDGSMETYSADEFNKDEVIAKGAYQGWSFGPMLLDNGMPMTEFDSNVKTENPRSAIGYYEPGHYVFVTVDGRGQSGSPGLSMKDLSKLFYDLDCKVAYNLDGGGSAKMMFGDTMVNHPASRSREISDILMIVENAEVAP